MSTNVRQCAIRGAHAGAMRSCSAAMSADPAAAAFDPIRPTVSGTAMSGPQAGDRELNAVDGESGGHGGGGVN